MVVSLMKPSLFLARSARCIEQDQVGKFSVDSNSVTSTVPGLSEVSRRNGLVASFKFEYRLGFGV